MRGGSDMCRSRSRFILSVVALAACALWGLPASAQSTDDPFAAECNGQLNISYIPRTPPFAVDGDTVRVQIDLGTGTITGGTSNVLTVNKFRFSLDCESLSLPGCTDDG